MLWRWLFAPHVTPINSVHQPRKRFGQHFLHDASVIQRIVEVIRPVPGQSLVEIGPGLGAITRPLLERMGCLHVIELDRDVIPHLQQRCRGMGALHVHQGDVLSLDFSRLRQDQQRLRMVGNLPYNISTPLLFHLLAQAEQIQDMYFMLQKEVVQRMVAGPDEPAYGRLSVMLQYRCRADLLFTVGAEAFSPPPKVESAFVRLLPYRELPIQVDDEIRFSELVRRAFSQRRKTLRNSLGSLLCAADIEAVGIDPGVRPQTLSLAEFAALSNYVQ